MKILTIALFIFGLSVGQGCFLSAETKFAQNKKVKLGETFILNPDETAETEDGKLKVRLKGVGRTISESGETEYAEFQVWLNKQEQNITISERGNSRKTVGNFVIELINAESFGKTNCELKISHKN